MNTRTHTLFLMGVAFLSTGCSGPAPPANVQQATAASSERVWLDPVRYMGSLTGRSVISCPAGKCIVLHPPPKSLPNEQWFEELKEEASKDSSKAVTTIEDPQNRWCQATSPHSTKNTFNCCTYAIGDVVGLTPNDWITPEPCGATCYTVPMQVLLDSYFVRVKSYSRGFDAIESDMSLRSGDVLCCVTTTGKLPCYIHAGRISNETGRNYLISKLGTGPLAHTSINVVLELYALGIDEIWVFRAKPNAGVRHSG